MVMITRIGICAGQILDYLEHRGGKSSLNQIISDIKESEETIFMALGRLAGQGFIIIEGTKPELSVRLKLSQDRNIE